MSHGQTLKQLLLQKPVLLVPGVYDGLSTRLIEEAGLSLSKNILALNHLKQRVLIGLLSRVHKMQKLLKPLQKITA